MDGPDRDDGRVERRNFPGDDALKRVDQSRGRDDRVERLVRRGPVPPGAGKDDLELVDGGHLRACDETDLSDGKLVPEVDAERRADPFENAVRGHRFRPSSAFFRRLKERADRGPGGSREQAPRHREADRDVSVVAAGVHAAGLFRGVGNVVLLLQGQRVHVGADHQPRRSGRPEVARDAGSPDPLAGRQADRANFPADDRRRSGFRKRELGMPVEISPDRDERGELRLGKGFRRRSGHAGDHSSPSSRSILPRSSSENGLFAPAFQSHRTCVLRASATSSPPRVSR